MYCPYVWTARQIVAIFLLSNVWIQTGRPANLDTASVRVVALSGNSPPGLPESTTWGGFQSPIITSKGDVVFRSWFEGPGTNGDNNDSIWSERDGQLHLVARGGEPAPGTNAVFHEFNNIPAMNVFGDVSFSASLNGTGVTATNNAGFWVDVDGTVSIVARGGEAAPGTPNEEFGSFGSAYFFGNSVLTNDGTIGFTARLRSDGPLKEGLWSGSATELGLAILDGMPVIGGTFGGFNASPVFNQFGDISFEGEHSSFGETIFRISDDNIQIVAAARGQYSDAIDGASFDGFNAPVINGRGDVAFEAATKSPRRSEAIFGIWSETANELRLIAQSGDEAPGTTAEAHFGPSFHGGLLINDAGEVAFQTRLRDTVQKGIWSEGGGSLHLVALEGESAPGTSPGTVFADAFSNSVLNQNGQIAFLGEVSHPAEANRRRRGIWAEDKNGSVQLIALEGEPFLLSHDDSRLLTGLEFIGNNSEVANPTLGFNDSGQLTFKAIFSDNSQAVILSNAVAIPEPSTLQFLMLTPILLRILRIVRGRKLDG